MLKLRKIQPFRYARPFIHYSVYYAGKSYAPVEIYPQTTTKAQTRGESPQGDTTCMRKKKRTIETKQRRLALFDALAMKNFDWLFLINN